MCQQTGKISLSKEFFGGKECAIEVKVKVLYGDKGNDIISQYVAFTKVCNEQVKLSAEEIAGCFTELSVENIQEIKKGLLQTV